MHSAAYHDCVSPGYADRGTPPTFNARHPRIELPDLNGELIALQSKEALFLAGEKKNEFYRVDAGVLLISTPETDGSLGESRLAFPGEYLGLGFLSEHPSSARAIVASTVSSYPLNKVDETSEHCPVLRQKLNEAVQLEFNQLARKGRGERSSRPSHCASGKFSCSGLSYCAAGRALPELDLRQHHPWCARRTSQSRSRRTHCCVHADDERPADQL